MLAKQIRDARKDYEHLKSLIPMHVLRTESEYKRATAALDFIVDEIGGDENHPLAELAEALSVFVATYEDEHYPIPDASAMEVLRYLMETHNLTQNDLSEIGSQGVVSEILSGKSKRQLNIRQIKALAKRFNVSPAVFIDA